MCARKCRWVIATIALCMAMSQAAFAREGSANSISVGGRKVQIVAKGDGSPTVVFESGFAGGLFLWNPALDKVATRTHVLAYERAGLGASDMGPDPRTAKQIALELHELLRVSSAPRPYVIVGHSMGGLYTRVFAHEYPQDVAAMVFVDPATEGYYDRLRVETPTDWANAPNQMTEGMRKQWAGLPESLEQARRAWPLRKLPTVIFTSQKPLGAWPLKSPDDMTVWLKEHNWLAEKMPGAEHIVLTEDNHLTILRNPQLSQKIIEIVDRVRTASK
jgi:pimeloyl-ACP methyl ester carboxylesterase